jgi:hypothetical protein
MVYKFLKSNISNLVIVVLILILLLQKCDSSSQVVPAPKIDTVLQYVEIHHTVKSKPVYIHTKKDTIWMDSIVYKPDTGYVGLLDQYLGLGNKHFATNTFKTEFSLGKYGNATVIDTIRQNKLIASGFEYDILVPEKTITVIEQAPPKREVYLGVGAYGDKINFIDGLYVGGLYKDKQDRITGVSVGYGSNNIQFGISSYWKLKLK